MNNKFNINIFNNIKKDYKNKIKDDASSFLEDNIKEISEEEYQELYNDISENKKQEIYRKLISNTVLNDSISKERADNIFRYLINKEESFTDSDIEFITYYIIYLNYYKIKYTEDGREKKQYKDLKMPKIKFVAANELPDFEKTFAAYHNSFNTVYINKDKSVEPFKNGNKDKIFAYMQIISHEMIHFKQGYEANKNIPTESSFKKIISDIIRIQSFDNKKQNYRFRQEEVEAQVESMQYAVEFARIYFPEYIEYQEEMLSMREDYLLEEALSNQHDDTNAIVLRELFDIGGLSVTIGNDPETYLTLYPQLLAFFDKEGHIRSEKELVLV